MLKAADARATSSIADKILDFFKVFSPCHPIRIERVYDGKVHKVLQRITIVDVFVYMKHPTYVEPMEAPSVMRELTVRCLKNTR